jgi:phosphate transport system substrate-binding protein
VADFINFFLTYVDDEIGEVGYFPASDDAILAAQQAWLGAMN